MPSFNFCYKTQGKEPCCRQNCSLTGQFSGKLHPVLDKSCLISITYPKINCLKNIPFASAVTHTAYIWKHLPPWDICPKLLCFHGNDNKAQ